MLSSGCAATIGVVSSRCAMTIRVVRGNSRSSLQFALKKNCATTTGVVSDPDYHTQMNCNAEERRRQINSFASSPIQYQYSIVKHSTHDQLVFPNRRHRRAGKRVAVIEIDLFHHRLLRIL